MNQSSYCEKEHICEPYWKMVEFIITKISQEEEEAYMNTKAVVELTAG